MDGKRLFEKVQIESVSEQIKQKKREKKRIDSHSFDNCE